MDGRVNDMDQYKLLVYFGWLGAMLIVGMVLRAKIPILRNMLMPSCVIGGTIGFFLINFGVLNLDVNLFSAIAAQLFTLSFISIGLTAPDKASDGKKQAKEIVTGSLGIGMAWCILFILQTILGCAVFQGWKLLDANGIDPVYGMLLARAYAQGPGQAAANGLIFESFGWENATMVGMTFAAFGFLFAFLFGVPLARWGLKRNLTRYQEEISKDVLVGIFSKGVDKPSAGKQTTHSGNIDSMAFHVAVLMVSYLITYHWTFWAASYLNETWSRVCIGMIFIWGMVVGYLVRFVLTKLNLIHMLDNDTQKRLTGWSTDFLIVAAFMAVSVKMLGAWFIPILVVCIIGAIVTFVVCLFFGQRFGAKHDFERTLGLYGMATGTAPSGIALIRIVDPELKTTSAVESGGSNIFMNFNLLLVPINIAAISGAMELWPACGILAAFFIPLMIILKVGGAFNKKTFVLNNKCDPPGNCDV